MRAYLINVEQPRTITTTSYDGSDAELHALLRCEHVTRLVYRTGDEKVALYIDIDKSTTGHPLPEQYWWLEDDICRKTPAVFGRGLLVGRDKDGKDCDVPFPPDEVGNYVEFADDAVANAIAAADDAARAAARAKDSAYLEALGADLLTQGVATMRERWQGMTDAEAARHVAEMVVRQAGEVEDGRGPLIHTLVECAARLSFGPSPPDDIEHIERRIEEEGALMRKLLAILYPVRDQPRSNIQDVLGALVEAYGAARVIEGAEALKGVLSDPSDIEPEMYDDDDGYSPPPHNLKLPLRPWRKSPE